MYIVVVILHWVTNLCLCTFSASKATQGNNFTSYLTQLDMTWIFSGLTLVDASTWFTWSSVLLQPDAEIKFSKTWCNLIHDTTRFTQYIVICSLLIIQVQEICNFVCLIFPVQKYSTWSMRVVSRLHQVASDCMKLH